MSNGIYPDYVGPTAQYRLNSLYPDWVKGIVDTIIDATEPWLGGIEVLRNPYEAMTLISSIGTVARKATTALLGIQTKRDVRLTEEPGIDVVDEDLGL